MNNSKPLVLIALLLCSITANAQTKNHDDYINDAEQLYEKKDYQASAIAYSNAFAANGGLGSPNDRYNAACSWALAGNADSAYAQLNRIATKGNYTNLSHLLSDADLKSLHTDKRWEEVVIQVRKNKEKQEENYDKPLVAMLDTIYMTDQEPRMALDELEKKYGQQSKEVKAEWARISKLDSINVIKVTQILDKYGWLGYDKIGRQGNTTLFLVIQHADIAVQEKYLPMMRQAVKDRKAQPSALALLEDRVALRKGGKQTYGSQIGMDENGKAYVQPLEDPDHVDERRASVGLGPLSGYVSNWQIQWDVEEYKKQLPTIEALEKKRAAKSSQ
jgi:hypothetical protein